MQYDHLPDSPPHCFLLIMSMLLKRKNALTNDALLDLADLVVPQLVANMRAIGDGDGNAKRAVTALTAERARKMAEEARALMQLCEKHAATVSTASLDSLVADTMRHILSFATHAMLLAFRRTSRRHRLLVDSMPAMCVARMTSRPPALRKITAHPSLGCVLDNKLAVHIHCSPIIDDHRAAMRHMPVMRYVSLDNYWLSAHDLESKRRDLRAQVDASASLPAVALTMSRSGAYHQRLTPDNLDDIELTLGRRVDSILFSSPPISGLFDKPRNFKRLAVSTGKLDSTSLYRLRLMVSDYLVIRVEEAHCNDINKLLTNGAPPAPMETPGAASRARRRGDGPKLMMEVPSHCNIEWSRDALMTVGESFSCVYVHRYFAPNVFSGTADTLQPLVAEHPELAAFLSVDIRAGPCMDPKFVDFWREFKAI